MTSSNPMSFKVSKSQNPTRPLVKGALILVSPEGTVYMLNENDESIRWSFEMKSICNAYHVKDEKDYIDAKTDSQGNIDLYRHSSGSPPTKIPWGTEDELRSYVKQRFGADTNVQSYTTHVDLDPNTGYRFEESSPPTSLRITRCAYVISKHSEESHWQLDFSKFKAESKEGAKDSSGSSYSVRHTCSKEEFISFWEKRKNFKFSRSLMKDMSGEDICLKDKLNVGGIKIDKPEINVRGSSKIFKGKHRGVIAAIKKMSTTAGIATIHENLVASNQHHNISRFFGAETSENGDLLFAFELCPSRLDLCLPELRRDRRIEISDIMRGIIHGVYHLHKEKLCHGNITPWKILLTNQMIPKLCGVGGCKKLTDKLRGEDFIALGRLIAYCFSQLTISTEDEYKSTPSDDLLNGARKAGEMEAYELASLLIKNENLPSVSDILRLPWLWDACRKLQFLRAAYDLLVQREFLEKRKISYLRGHIKSALDKFKDKQLGWKVNFPTELVTHMENNKPEDTSDYNYFYMLDLLRFLRNLISHQSERTHGLTTEAAKKCVKSDESLASHLRMYLPSLLMDVYHVLDANTLAKYELRSYYYKS